MEKKKQRIYAVIALVTLALLVVGATYAYFQNQYGESSQTDVKVTTYTTDLLTFETGDVINITADQDSFAQGKGNQTGSSFAKAILQANSKTNVATANYYIYLNIESNEFTYTDSNKAELVLQVTDNSGNPVTSIDGLTYVTVVDGNGTSISGFDITEKSGLITLVNNKEISASPKTEEQYNIALILVNYDFDQNNNAGKNFNAKLMIQKNEYKQTIANTCKGGQSLDTCIVAMSGIDDKLYYHDSSLVNGAGDNSYRYAGGDICMYKNYEVYTEWGNNACKNAYYVTDETNFMQVFDDTIMTKPTDVKWDSTNNKCVTLSGEDVNLLDDDITEDTCSGTAYFVTLGNGYFLGIEKATDVAPYKYSSVNNYICFGSDEETCPDDNLYRIIGVFDGRVKLIKADYATSNLLGTDGDYKTAYSYDTTNYKGNLSVSNIGGYMWNYNGLSDHKYDNEYGSNTWSTSLLNKTNLNTNYLNNIGSKWANMIDITTWKVGGNSEINISLSIPSVAYQNEIVNPVSSTTYEAKVGLMYASDYGFAAEPYVWTTKLGDYGSSSIPSQNWMYMGLDEWVITRNNANSKPAFMILSTGEVSSCTANYDYAIRPVFFLTSSVKFVSGDGTKNNPVRILIN